MRHTLRRWVLGVAVMAAAGFAWASGTFEGVVNYRYSFQDGKTMDMEFKAKGHKVRVDMNQKDMQMAMIMDSETKKMTMLMTKQKMYSVSKLDPALVSKSSEAKLKGKFSKASGSKTILGYKCDHYVYESENGKSDMWGTSELGTLFGMGGGSPGSKSVEEWAKVLRGKGIFLLEMDHTAKNGKNMTMVATAVEKKSLSDSLFTIPAGYKKLPSMEDMGMGKAGKGGKHPSAEDMLKGMKPKLPF